jgi:hypothetical protein
VPGKYSTGQIIKALIAIFTFMALSIRLFIIVTASDNIFGITKRALFFFRSAQFPYRGVTMSIIYQAFYIHLHQLDSFCGVEETSSPFTTSRPWNPT